MEKEQFLSTSELAKILGISRIAVYKKIKSGRIKATKFGRNFIIDKNNITDILPKTLKKELNREEKASIERAVKKTVKEYGETLRLLGKT